MTKERDIPIALIDASGRLRPIDPEWAQAIAVSFKERGQDQAVGVRVKGDRFKLSFGGHRLAAAKLCGWTHIRAKEIDGNDLQGRLAEIDENLMRYELTPLDRAIFLAERKRVWEELYPEAKHGGDRKSKRGRQDQVAKLATRFTAEVAERCGFSERTVRRACQLAEAFDADTLDLVRKTALADNQAQLFQLIKLKPAERRRAVSLLARGEVASFADALARIGLRAEVDREEALFRTLVSAWSRAGAKVRRRFRDHIASEKTAKVA